jgi:transposase
MARSKIISKLDSTQPVYIGLDVHKSKWSVCIYHQDEVIEQHTIPGKYETLKKIIKKYELLKCYSAYEAGFLGFYLHRYLEKDGVNNIVIATNKIPAETGNYVKTDRRDAKKIAFSLSKRLLKGIHIPSEELVDLRQILRTREKLIRTKRSTINRIKMLLHQFEIKFTSQGLTREKIEEIKNYDLPVNTKISIELYLETLELILRQTAKLQSRAHTIALNSKYANNYKIITTIPGIGPLTGALLCFEIGDFSRFSSSKKLASYIGITPREFSSGEHIYKGRITGQGNGAIRSALIEASWVLIGKDDNMKKFYNKVKLSSGSGKKAIVAVGRKLTHIIHSIVLRNQCYTIVEC